MKERRKKAFDKSSILFLIFALFAVLILINEMNKHTPNLDGELKRLADGQRVGELDSLYYNFPFYFSVKCPDSSWTIEALPQDTLVNYVDTSQPLLEQVAWFTQMNHNTDSLTTATAVARIGVLKWQEKVQAEDTAISIMAQVLGKYETARNRARILQETTIPAHHALRGAYWALVLPPSDDVALNVWVLSVLPRRNLTYIILCQTTEKEYENVNTSFEKLVSGFAVLSMINYPAEWKF